MFNSWIQEQHSLRLSLFQARSKPDPTRVRSVIAHVLHRYETHYRTRSAVARSDPVHAFTSPFATPLQRALYWVAGWRPNTLIHLLYSESGLKFEAQLDDLLRGVHSGDIGDISPSQLTQIDELQTRTIDDEIEIDKELGRIQESAPDPFLPSDSDLDSKMERVGRVVELADELRMRTLRGVVGILDPLQAVEMLAVLVEWEIGLNGLGLEMERGPARFRK